MAGKPAANKCRVPAFKSRMSFQVLIPESMLTEEHQTECVNTSQLYFYRHLIAQIASRGNSLAEK